MNISTSGGAPCSRTSRSSASATQYAQSMSLWSPDGSAFAYPGISEDGQEGIWIQSARPDRAPVLVADGDFVACSSA
jgi:hypothetical protein